MLPKDDSTTKDWVKQIKDNLQVLVFEGQRLTSLINNVLDLSNMEAGKIEWHMEKLAVPEFLNSATSATKSFFNSNDLILVKNYNNSLPLVYGDRDKLTQVLVNLISNAVKFSENGEVICNAVHRDEDVIVSVVDSGIGIAPED